MDRFDVYLAVPKAPGVDWQAPGTSLAQLRLDIPVASGLNAVLAVAGAIRAGTLAGRQLDWGAWIAPMEKSAVAAFLTPRGWPLPPEFSALSEDEAYYLVAVEG